MIVVLGGPMSRIERVALVAGLLMSAALMWPVRGAVSDTTYAWLHIAQHLAQGAGLVFNPGERVYATTNPLWLTLLADGMALGLDGLTVARVLGMLATLMTVPLFLQLLRRTVRSPALRAVGTVAWASQAWMARWSLSGLETTLAVALVLGGFVALTEGADWGERPVRTGALWSLAAMTRPGAVLLLALWGTALLIDAQSRPGLRRLVFGLLPPLLIYGSWLLFARLYFGTFWPSVLSTVPSLNPSIGEWWRRFSVDFGKVASTEGVIIIAGIIALVFVRPRANSPDRSALRILPLAWVLLLPALFAARGLEAGARQLLLAIPVVHWLVWWTVDRWWSGREQRPHASARAAMLGAALAAVVVVQNLHTFRRQVVPEARANEQVMNRTLVRWGRWLGAHEPPGTWVASDTPGALAYFGNVRVLDLNGAFSPPLREPELRMPRARLVSELAFGRVVKAQYLIDQSMTSRELFATSPNRRAFERLDESNGYAFYRIHWDRVAEDSAATQ